MLLYIWNHNVPIMALLFEFNIVQGAISNLTINYYKFFNLYYTEKYIITINNQQQPTFIWASEIYTGTRLDQSDQTIIAKRISKLDQSWYTMVELNKRPLWKWKDWTVQNSNVYVVRIVYERCRIGDLFCTQLAETIWETKIGLTPHLTHLLAVVHQNTATCCST